MDPFDELNKPKLDETERRTMAFKVFCLLCDSPTLSTKTKPLSDAENMVTAAFGITDIFIEKYLTEHAR